MISDNYPAGLYPLNDTLLGKFREEVLSGLHRKAKRLPSKYFYDKTGDMLFQRIMACPEYYLTNCELEIFQSKTADLAQIITSDNGTFDLIELGAGDATKSQYLLKYLSDQKASFTYMPIDISGNILSVLEKRLKDEITGLDVTCLEGEYFEMLRIAAELSGRRKIVMFLGANIGNMEPREAKEFCRDLRAHLAPGDLVLMGVDLKKHPKLIWEAYNDSAGLTSRFNLNLLHRINRELKGDFDPDQFEHYQTYDPGSGACKSHLVSLQDQIVTIGDSKIVFGRDESVFMEISQKYTLEEVDNLARETGFVPVYSCPDTKGWFVDAFWKAV
ncbi:L-histidine N(alpha)-methyltransferase [Pontibacter diazotrophicus]|uniref:L-histidine N(Alpha)-methyltransferase n=1 Tax=Pontibacter diazotrophicus TaxID=1400979 RepID=A0A3D8LGF6_9BACT|nr:L-histidine N(alpha)-methyltransferase [Pontibacter diazotrophicus]RDV16521.1 L-histidine N(alpha)-methyltransferase [Pontibacter diazotrophicus]